MKEIQDIENKIGVLHVKKLSLFQAKEIQEGNKTDEIIKELKSTKKKLEVANSSRPPYYSDRTILMLRLESHDKAVCIGNIHMPCEFKDQWIVTSIAFQAKQEALRWTDGFELAPLVFCGDFNSMPGQTGFECFEGTLAYDDSKSDLIPKDTFKNVITDERWINAFSTRDGCTCYGLTKNSVDAQRAQALSETPIADDSRSASDSTESDTNTYSLSFKPRNYHLDHFFIRDKTNSLDITKRICPTLDTVKALTGDDPLPNLEIHEPSDHLPIELGLQFK
jgi:hypothetical protein